MSSVRGGSYSGAKLCQIKYIPSVRGGSYVGAKLVPGSCVRPTRHFVAHAWSRPFRELVDNLLATERQLAADEGRLGGKDEPWKDISLWIGAATNLPSLAVNPTLKT
eukprot:1182990-Prorocentrum_minimum.AAC.5